MTTIQNDPDYWTDDEYDMELWKIEVLNRIDQEYGCDVMVYVDYQDGEDEHCGMPEWEPFSNRCYDHTPGVMHSWDM